MMNLDERNRTLLPARLSKAARVVAIAFALLLTLMLRISAQPTASTSATPDEVFRIVVAEDVDEKEGRDNRLMLETLGYIPVQLIGNFEGHDGAVVLGNYPTQVEAQRVREQLIRDGFTPGEIVRVRQGQSLGSGFFSVLVATYPDEASARQHKENLQKAYPNLVKLLALQQSGQQKLVVGPFISKDEARAIEAHLRASLGYPQAQIVSSLSGEPVSLNFTSPSPEWKSKIADEIRRSSQRELSDREVEEITTLLSRKQRNSPEERSSVAEEIERLNQQLRDLKHSGCGVSVEIPLTEEAQRTAEQRRKISQLFRESNELVKSGQNEAALVKLREILALEPENQIALARAEVVLNLTDCQEVELRTEDDYETLKREAVKFMRAEEEMKAKYETLKKDALSAESAGTLRDLIRARANWREIANLHERHREQAKAEFARISKRIDELIRASESKKP